MAVDYFHHIVITGPWKTVSEFVHRIALVVERRVAGKTTRATVPFSFESLYAMVKVSDEFPGEAFDITRWPIVARGSRAAEVRYRFHTRNLELDALLKKLSRKFPSLKFALVTICLDDMDFKPLTFRNGKARGKWLGGEWREQFWQEAARELEIDVQDAYDDDAIETIVDGNALDAAVKIATGSDRRYN